MRGLPVTIARVFPISLSISIVAAVSAFSGMHLRVRLRRIRNCRLPLGRRSFRRDHIMQMSGLVPDPEQSVSMVQHVLARCIRSSRP